MKLRLQNRPLYPQIVEATMNHEPTISSLKYTGKYIGKRFGDLTAVAYPATKEGIRRGGVICRCDCGTVIVVWNAARLLNGDVKRCFKCGHKYRSESAKRRWRNTERHSKYGELRNERLYSVWMGVRSRSKSKYGAYADVGMCDEWQDYRVFREWALSHGYDDKAPKGQCTIDRINPYGDYEPSNCRFVDMKTQAQNKRKRWNSLDEETRQALLASV